MGGGKYKVEKKEIINAMQKYGVVPAIVIESPKDAEPLADALLEGGLPLIEITFRTEKAAEVMRTLREKRPEVLLAAGTILSVEHLLLARECGAQFGFAPGLNPEIAGKARDIDFLFIPGVMTPSEVEQALSFGNNIMKFYPAVASGGLQMLKALASPYSHLGVKFTPTGGIDMGNLADYLKYDKILAVGGTWIAKSDLIVHKRWDTIKENARAAREVVLQIRG
jgi:2-dehydro-3-deoxyphosphogluconate aldolase/(4S)-4-hydroxy-2-oxoglutarate aldolase